jgi:hypothetical protein
VTYPTTPGYARDSSASRGPLTADEVATSLGFYGLKVLKIRPRLTELRKLGLIERTDDVRPSALENDQHVMRLSAAGHDALKDRVNSFHVPNVAAPAAEVTGQLTLVIP